MSVVVAIATLVIPSTGWPDRVAQASAAQPAPEPGYREGGQIGGGGAAEPASSAGTVTFLVSTAAMAGVIVGGVLFSRRQQRRRASASIGPAPTHPDPASKEHPTP